MALLKDKKDRNIVTFHDSMAYFAKTFDLNIVGVVQKNPGTEPNETQLTKLIALCADDKNPVRVISVEPQYGTSGSADQSLKELRHRKVPDPVLVEFDPLETVSPNDLTAGLVRDEDAGEPRGAGEGDEMTKLPTLPPSGRRCR